MRSRIIINYSQVDCDGLWLGPVKPLDDIEVIYVQGTRSDIPFDERTQTFFLVCCARTPGGRRPLDTPLFTMKLFFSERLYQ